MLGKEMQRHNIAEYVRAERRTFAELPPADADLLVFAALLYLEFERYEPWKSPETDTVDATDEADATNPTPATANATGVTGSTPTAAPLADTPLGQDSPFAPPVALGDLPKYGPTWGYVEHDCNPHGMLPFLQAVMASPRFAPVALERFRCLTCDNPPVQFGAACFPITTELVVVAFRGTDSTLRGWHESFNLAWQPCLTTKADKGVVALCQLPPDDAAAKPAPVEPAPAVAPGVAAALAYLRQAADAYPHARFLLCGHSKGGFLAECAAVLSPTAIATRIERCVSFDGLGLFRLDDPAAPEIDGHDEAILAAYAAAPVAARPVRYIFPSQVGLMLERRDPASFLHTVSLNPQLNHNVCSVAIERVPAREASPAAAALAAVAVAAARPAIAASGPRDTRAWRLAIRTPDAKELANGLTPTRKLGRLMIAERRLLATFLIDAARESSTPIELADIAPLRNAAIAKYRRSLKPVKKTLRRILLTLAAK